MAIKIRADLHPYSFQSKGYALLDIDIWSSPKGRTHGYRITYGNTELVGHIAKTKSGHRNLLHVLRDVLADIDLDALGENYIKTPADERTQLCCAPATLATKSR